MKKLISLLVVLVILTGCSSTAITSLSSEANKDIITVGDQTISANDIYGMMQHQNLSDSIIDQAVKTLIDNYVEVDETIEARAQELLEENKEYFGDSFETLILSQYETEEAFVEQQLIPAAKQEKMTRDYFEANFDSIINSQAPRLVYIIEVANNADANRVVEGLKADESIEDLVEKYGTDDAIAEQTIIATTSTVSDTVKAFVKDAEKGDISETPIAHGSRDTFYVVQIVESDANEFKDDFFAIYSTNNNNLDTVFIHFFKEFDFKIHDQFFYDAVKASDTTSPYLP